MSEPAVPAHNELREPIPAWSGRALGAVAVALVLLFWFLATRGEAEARWISPVILPSPGEVIASIPALGERNLEASIAATLIRVFLGFGLAILVGIPLGIAAASRRGVEAFFQPFALFGRNVPVAALIPLTLMFFGTGEKQKVLFLFIACVPFVFGLTVSAVLGVPQRYVDTARTLGASSVQVVFKVLIPLSLPNLYDSLRQLFGLAFGYIMLVELIDAPRGLGQMLLMSQRRGPNEHVFLVLFIIVALAWGIDWSLRAFHKGVFPHIKREG